jgi:hypothetical protein
MALLKFATGPDGSSDAASMYDPSTGHQAGQLRTGKIPLSSPPIASRDSAEILSIISIVWLVDI